MAGEGIGVTERVAKTTISHWADKVTDSVHEMYIWLQKLQERGKVKADLSGGELRWIPKYKRRELRAHVDAAQIQFVRPTLVTNAVLPWRSCYVSELVTEKERLQNRNKEAMVKLFTDKFMDMHDDAVQLFSKQLWDDGNAATADNCTWHGAFSFLSTTGQTDTDLEATTYNDSYGGISTALGSLQADSTKDGYDAWTPTVISTNQHDSGGNNQNWEDFADKYLRAGLLECDKGGDDRIHGVFLTKTAFRQLLDILTTKERLEFKPTDSPTGRKPGFGGSRVLYFDGCEVTWDQGMPTTENSRTVQGVGINFNRVELCCLGPKGNKSIFRGETDYDINQDAVKMFIRVFGNMKFASPRFHLGLLDLAS